MPSYQWITHNSVKVLFIDVASQNVQELQSIIAKVSPVIEKEPSNSIRCLVSTKGGFFNSEMSKALTDFSAHNKPYMLKTALIGVEGLQKMLYNATLIVTRRKNMALKNTKEEALNWLAQP